eukprot:scaffold1525_cov142-Cylindrotheca_fusiformis.AAC.192
MLLKKVDQNKILQILLTLFDRILIGLIRAEEYTVGLTMSVRCSRWFERARTLPSQRTTTTDDHGANRSLIKQLARRMTLSTPISSPSRSGLPSSPAGGETLDAILALSADGTSFEEIMKERNRIRKEREEYNVAELRVQILRLEDALAAETKRRVDATTALDGQAREQIYEMEQRLRAQMVEDNERLESRLEKLEGRLEDLEERWEKDSASQLEAISRKSQDFETALKQLQLEQDTERKARLRREGTLLQQVENHATEFEERWKMERNERENRIGHLENSLNQQMAKRMQDEKIFQQQVQAELEGLQRDLEEESMERKAQDEEIVEALNRYTKQLQESLSILSSD